MIDVEQEEAVSLTTARHFFPSKPSRSTVYRWTTIGYRGLILDSIKVGHARLTTRQAAIRFIRATNGEGT